ncbi:MAG: transglutaminase domain-containing protein [Bacteroidota bacterium]|nr:transglutaminase domain-containing protein [Bacteroidota bacterium]
MKKVFYIPTLCFFLLSGPGFLAYGQKKISEPANSITPALLARELTGKCTTDLQKVTAIFRWITDNISYNMQAITRNKNSALFFDEPDDTSKALKPLDERVAETVLRRRVAVCDGYSRLFKSLCDYAGIRSEVVTGYARVSWNNSRSKFRSNHKWNAVFIDSSWYLLDATWASGFVTYRGDEFVHEYDSKYFLSPPEQFIRDHYPEDLVWTLLKKPPTLSEFYQAPFHYTAFIRSGITSYLPAKGIIEAAAGDSIHFEVKVRGDKNIYVSAAPPVEPDDNGDNDDDEPEINYEKNAVCTYTVTGNSPEWLYVICNGETILRYKLNIKKPDNRTAMLSSK